MGLRSVACTSVLRDILINKCHYFVIAQRCNVKNACEK